MHKPCLKYYNRNTRAELSCLNTHWLRLSLLLRLSAAVSLMMPVGVCLGMFYPFAIAALVRNDRHAAVPIVYGISALASVIGATYAMIMVIAFGFDRLMCQAAPGYVLLAVFVFVHARLAGRRVRSLSFQARNVGIGE